MGGVPGCRHGIRGRRVRRRRRAAAAAAESSGSDEGRQGDRRRVDGQREGRRHLLRGQGHVRRSQGGHRGVQQGQPGPERQAPRVPGVRRRAAQPVHPAPARQVRRLRRLRGRRRVDRRVRLAEVAARHDALRREPQGRVHPVDALLGRLRGQALGRAARHRRRLPLLPQGQDQAGPRDLAGGLQGGAGGQRHRLPGRGLRGPDGELPRAGLRGRRQDPLRRRQEVRHRLAREPQGAAVHGRRHQERRGAEGRHDLHGGGGAARVRGRPRRLRAQVALRLRARQQEGLEGQGQVRGRAVSGVRGRRQGRDPRRPQHGHLDLLEEPGRSAEADRLPDVGEADDQERRRLLQDAGAHRVLRGPGGQEGDAVPRPSSSRRSSRPRAGPSRRSTPRSRRRSTRTSTRRCRARRTRRLRWRRRRRTWTRPWPPSRATRDQWKPPRSRPAHRRGGAPGASRSAASRR